MSHSSLPDFFRCPTCLGGLSADATGPRCVACGGVFAWTSQGRPDFRRPGRRMMQFAYAYDPEWDRFPVDLIRLEWPEHPLPFEPSPVWEATEISLVRSIPVARPGERSLDLGCGSDRQRFREPLSRLGYEPVGFDMSGEAPDLLADAHVLPFADQAFDLLVTFAVFEHLKHPHVAMAEAARVARPGAHFVGSIAFGEPFHISYFHHSPLAVLELLESSGFECRALILTNKWSAFLAHLEMGFAGARYPPWLRGWVAKGFLRATLVHAWVKRMIGRGPGPLQQDRVSFARSHSATVGFIAVRSPRGEESRVCR